MVTSPCPLASPFILASSPLPQHGDYGKWWLLVWVLYFLIRTLCNVFHNHNKGRKAFSRLSRLMLKVMRPSAYEFLIAWMFFVIPKNSVNILVMPQFSRLFWVSRLVVWVVRYNVTLKFIPLQDKYLPFSASRWKLQIFSHMRSVHCCVFPFLVLVHFWSSAGKLLSKFYRNITMLTAKITSRTVLYGMSWVLSICSHRCVSSESAHHWNNFAKRCEQILTKQ